MKLRKFLDYFLSIEGDDPLEILRSRMTLAFLILISAANVVTLLFITLEQIDDKYLGMVWAVLVVFAALAGFAHSGAHWPRYVFLLILIALILVTLFDVSPGSSSQRTPTASLVLPIVIVPLVLESWWALLILLLEFIATLLFAPPELAIQGNVYLWITLGLVAFVSWASSMLLERVVHQVRKRAQETVEIYKALQEERRVEESHAKELERRATYLRAITSVAREAASVLDLDELLSRVVKLISDRFGYYHTGIFLLDAARENAVLRAASSEGGQRMLARHHQLAVGGESIIGYVTATGKPRIALDVGADEVFFNNPDLPETRSEMALPLRARGEIIGALDVQSTEAGAFTEEDVKMLAVLADQLAVAIDNARLFQQAQENLDAMQRAYGELRRDAWSELLQTSSELLGYRSDAQGVAPTDSWSPVMAQAIQTGEVVVEQAGDDSADRIPLAVPIKIAGSVIGVIDTYKPASQGEWQQEEIALLESLANQLSGALESARFYQDVQKRALLEQATREVTERLRQAVDVDTLMQVTVQEIVKALGGTLSFVWLENTSALGEQ